MIIDTFLEWVVISLGIMIAIFILVPPIPRVIGLFIGGLIPSPSGVNEWLRKLGL